MGLPKIIPILDQIGPGKIDILEDELSRVMATENTTLYNMGKKFGFLVIIISNNCYQVNIGNNTCEFST